MASLGQASQILQAAGAIVESLDSARRSLLLQQSAPEAGLSSGSEAGLSGSEAGQAGGPGRRLLASSAAFRMRTRRMLLRHAPRHPEPYTRVPYAFPPSRGVPYL